MISTTNGCKQKNNGRSRTEIFCKILLKFTGKHMYRIDTLSNEVIVTIIKLAMSNNLVNLVNYHQKRTATN